MYEPASWLCLSFHTCSALFRLIHTCTGRYTCSIRASSQEDFKVCSKSKQDLRQSQHGRAWTAICHQLHPIASTYTVVLSEVDMGVPNWMPSWRGGLLALVGMVKVRCVQVPGVSVMLLPVSQW